MRHTQTRDGIPKSILVGLIMIMIAQGLHAERVEEDIRTATELVIDHLEIGVEVAPHTLGALQVAMSYSRASQ